MDTQLGRACSGGAPKFELNMLRLHEVRASRSNWISNRVCHGEEWPTSTEHETPAMRAQRAAGVECSVDGSFSSQVVDEVLESGGVQYLNNITAREIAYEALDV